MRLGTRVLVVEDDHSIGRLLQLELGHRGLDVRWETNGLAALTAINEFCPDVVLLDVLLPGMDGERVLTEIRRRGDLRPVIMLTSRDGPREKVRSLDGGADDYVTKPFVIDELVARLNAVLRRATVHDVIRAGDLVINASTRRVERGSATIVLTAKEFDLLEYLGRHTRLVVSRDRILAEIWGSETEVDPNIVDVYIGYLRKKIELPGAPRLIHTIRGVGFSLRPD